MKRSLSAALTLSLALALPALAADKKPKKPTGTPSTLPPTSPMLVVPKPGDATTSGSSDGKLISSEMSGRDLEFFSRAVEAGRRQAFFVDLLKKSASSDQIKKLAEALTAAQGEENMHIAKLAAQKGWSVSLEPTAEDKKAADEIVKLSGSNLDKAAMDKVVAASGEALKAYQDAAQSSDPQIKNFAAQMLPLAEEKGHLVEKMTGAGAKAANQLFRHGAGGQEAPKATSPATPTAKATPLTELKATTPAPATPGATPKGKVAATPTPLPASKLPIATPPGSAAPSATVPPLISTPKPAATPSK